MELTLYALPRSVYRVVEFANGSNGPIIHNQLLFSERHDILGATCGATY